MILYILIGVGVLLALLAGVYNNLVRARIRTEEAFSDIDVQLKRRYDLIPNLIETVKGYAKHESKLFKEITEARSQAMKAHKGKNINKSAAAEAALGNALSGLMIQVENYPDLKANQNFLELQQELEDTENKIQAARRFFNRTVQEFNTKCQVFPSNIIAGIFGFKSKEFFEVEDAVERENVKVSF